MPDVTLRSSDLGVVGAFASARALDSIRPPEGVRACRIASDEVALVCRSETVGALLDVVSQQIAQNDSSGFALDLSDGWSGFALAGEVARAFSYLSALELPAPGGFAQGDVLRVPVRVLSREGEIDLLVPSHWGDYLRGAIVEALRALDLHDEASAI